MSDNMEEQDGSCSECTEVQATVHCVKCECNLCLECFSQIHSSSKYLKTHTYIELQSLASSARSTPVQLHPLQLQQQQLYIMCSKHAGKLVEFFCVTDGVEICSHCAVKGSHRDHDIITLDEHNKDMWEQQMGEANKALEVLENSMKRMKEMRAGVKLTEARQCEAVEKRFESIRQAVSARENAVLEELKAIYVAECEQLTHMEGHITEMTQNLKAAVTDSWSLMRDADKQAVLADISRLLTQPCPVLSETFQAPLLQLPSTLEEALSTYGVVRKGQGCVQTGEQSLGQLFKPQGAGEQSSPITHSSHTDIINKDLEQDSTASRSSSEQTSAENISRGVTLDANAIKSGPPSNVEHSGQMSGSSEKVGPGADTDATRLFKMPMTMGGFSSTTFPLENSGSENCGPIVKQLSAESELESMDLGSTSNSSYSALGSLPTDESLGPKLELNFEEREKSVRTTEHTHGESIGCQIQDGEVKFDESLCDSGEGEASVTVGKPYPTSPEDVEAFRGQLAQTSSLDDVEELREQFVVVSLPGMVREEDVETIPGLEECVGGRVVWRMGETLWMGLAKEMRGDGDSESSGLNVSSKTPRERLVENESKFSDNAGLPSSALSSSESSFSVLADMSSSSISSYSTAASSSPSSLAAETLSSAASSSSTSVSQLNQGLSDRLEVKEDGSGSVIASRSFSDLMGSFVRGVTGGVGDSVKSNPTGYTRDFRDEIGSPVDELCEEMRYESQFSGDDSFSCDLSPNQIGHASAENLPKSSLSSSGKQSICSEIHPTVSTGGIHSTVSSVSDQSTISTTPTEGGNVSGDRVLYSAVSPPLTFPSGIVVSGDSIKSQSLTSQSCLPHLDFSISGANSDVVPRTDSLSGANTDFTRSANGNKVPLTDAGISESNASLNVLDQTNISRNSGAVNENALSTGYTTAGAVGTSTATTNGSSTIDCVGMERGKIHPAELDSKVVPSVENIIGSAHNDVEENLGQSPLAGDLKILADDNKNWNNNAIEGKVCGGSGSDTEEAGYRSLVKRAVRLTVEKAVPPSIGCEEACVVAHVISPHKFYVQFMRDSSSLSDLSGALKEHCLREREEEEEEEGSSDSELDLFNVSTRRQILDLKIGDFALAKFSGDGRWYRAQITRVYPMSGKSVHRKFDVLFIDYGNSDTVLSNSVMLLEERFSVQPIMSHLCSLSGVKPRASDWSKEALQTFSTITTERLMLAKVLGMTKDSKLSLYLSWLPCPDVKTDIPHCVANVMVFLDLAKLTGSKKLTEAGNTASSGTCKRGESVKPLLPRIGQSVPTLVTNVMKEQNTFYAQVMGRELKRMDEIMKEMMTLYNSNESSVYTLLTPYVGDLCAVSNDVGGKIWWYRAVILDTRVWNQILVRHLDFGGTVVASVWQIRKLPDRFMEVLPQALHCRLSSIRSSIGGRGDLAKCGGEINSVNELHQLDRLALKVEDITWLKGETVLLVKASRLRVTKPTGENFAMKISAAMSATGNASFASSVAKSGDGNVSSSSSSVDIATNSQSSTGHPSHKSLADIARSLTDCQPIRSIHPVYGEESSRQSSSYAVKSKSVGRPKRTSVDSASYSKSSHGQTIVSHANLTSSSSFSAGVESSDSEATGRPPHLHNPSLLSSSAEAARARHRAAELSSSSSDGPSQLKRHSRSQRDLERGKEVKVAGFLPQGAAESSKYLDSDQKICDLAYLPDVLSADSGLEQAGLGMGGYGQTARDEFGMEHDHVEQEGFGLGYAPPQGDLIIEQENVEVNYEHFGEKRIGMSYSDMMLKHSGFKYSGAAQDSFGVGYGQVTPVNLGVGYGQVGSTPLGMECGDMGLGYGLQEYLEIGEMEKTAQFGKVEEVSMFGKVEQAEQYGIGDGIPLDQRGREVVVSLVLSPEELYVQDASQQLQLMSLMAELNSGDLETETEVTPDEWLVGQDCLAVFFVDQQWYRATIKNIVDRQATVHLGDYGYSAVVDTSCLRPLPSNIPMATSLPLCAERCHLYGIRSPVGDPQWSQAATDFMCQLIAGKKCFAEVKEDEPSIAGRDSVAVDLLYEVKVKGGALSADLMSRNSVTILLIESALALPSSTVARKNSEVNSFSDCSVTSSSGISLQQTSALHQTVATTHQKTDGDYTLPQRPAGSLRVTVTHNNEMGHLYVQECVEGEDFARLEAYFDHIHDCYRASGSEADTVWVMGQPVVARFHEDGRFYRGRIVGYAKREIKVMFVDYGNVELVNKNDLRTIKAEFLREPIKCFSCSLHAIIPVNGQWSKMAMRTVKHLTEGKKCCMKVKSVDEATMRLMIRLSLEDGRDLGEVLCSLDHAHPVEDDDDDDDDDVGDCNVFDIPDHVLNTEREMTSPYLRLPVSEFADLTYSVLYVQVTQVDRPDIVYMQQMKLDDTEEDKQLVERDEQLLQLDEQLQQLLEINQTYQKAAEGYDRIKRSNISIGTACVARFSADDCWYRALVVDVTMLHSGTSPTSPGHSRRALVGIRFIDYGSFQYLPISRLRVIPEEHLTLPAQGLRCHLAGVTRPAEASVSTQMSTEMKRLFADAVLIAVPRHMRNGDMYVDLYDKVTFTTEGVSARTVYADLARQYGCTSISLHHQQSSCDSMDSDLDGSLTTESD